MNPKWAAELVFFSLVHLVALGMMLSWATTVLSMSRPRPRSALLLLLLWIGPLTASGGLVLSVCVRQWFPDVAEAIRYWNRMMIGVGVLVCIMSHWRWRTG